VRLIEDFSIESSRLRHRLVKTAHLIATPTLSSSGPFGQCH
jgi:hypothetical protein